MTGRYDRHRSRHCWKCFRLFNQVTRYQGSNMCNQCVIGPPLSARAIAANREDLNLRTETTIAPDPQWTTHGLIQRGAVHPPPRKA